MIGPKLQLRYSGYFIAVETLSLFISFNLGIGNNAVIFNLFWFGMIAFPIVNILWLAYIFLNRRVTGMSEWVILLAWMGILGPVVFLGYILSRLH